ncbi:MAG: cytochrome B [Planctomycetes bacterium]|nr:cytochrome B [Planctomycetota bacterium]
MRKPRIGIFDFACCEGCQLQIVNLEEEILDLLGVVTPVEWREAMSDQAEKGESFDIALVEGSITREEDAERLREIRARAKFLIALGACATIGGVNKLKNNFGMNDVKETVYGEAADMPHLETMPTKALHEVVQVDYMVHGCPIEAAELAHVVRTLLAGKTPTLPAYPVCVECKLKENACRFEFGEICLGPITRAGCGARCPSEGSWCFGCRGLVDDPNTQAAREVMAHYGKTIDDLRGKMLLFNSK